MPGAARTATGGSGGSNRCGGIGASRRHDPRAKHLRQRIPAHREGLAPAEQVRGLPGLWQVAGHSKFFGRVAARDVDPLIDAANELFRDPLGVGTVAGPLHIERAAIRHEPRHAIARDEIGTQDFREPAERRTPPEIDLKEPVLGLHEPLRQEQVVLTRCVDVRNAPPVADHTHRRGKPVETERSRGLREWTGRAHGSGRHRWLVGSTGAQSDARSRTATAEWRNKIRSTVDRVSILCRPQGCRIERRGGPVKNPSLRLILMLVVGFALFVVPSAARFSADWLWFGEVGYRHLFSTEITTRTLVGAVAFGVTLFWLHANFLIALGGVRPAGPAPRLDPRRLPDDRTPARAASTAVSPRVRGRRAPGWPRGVGAMARVALVSTRGSVRDRRSDPGPGCVLLHLHAAPSCSASSGPALSHGRRSHRRRRRVRRRGRAGSDRDGTPRHRTSNPSTPLAAGRDSPCCCSRGEPGSRYREPSSRRTG